MDAQEIQGRFGPYKLLKRIARGGMGEVFLAQQDLARGYERTLVVKRILPHLSNDEKFVKMFLREAHTASKFQHENIVKIYQVGQERSQYYLAMEYVEGKDLRSFLLRAAERGEPIPHEISCFIIARVCRGLAYAHQKTGPGGECLNLVHRDVSPQNILLSYEGDIRLIDFGISKAADGGSLTRAGSLKGKVPYLSPEQARGEAQDHRSDIFSTGLVFLELLSGRTLFAGCTEYQILERLRTFSVEKNRPLWREELPAPLGRILDLSLHETPGTRYTDVLEMGREIDCFLHETGYGSGRSGLSCLMNRLFETEMAAETMELDRTCTVTASPGPLQDSPREQPVATRAEPEPVPPEPRDRRILKHKLVILVLLLIIVLEAVLFIAREYQWKKEGRDRYRDLRRSASPESGARP